MTLKIVARPALLFCKIRLRSERFVWVEIRLKAEIAEPYGADICQVRLRNITKKFPFHWFKLTTPFLTADVD